MPGGFVPGGQAIVTAISSNKSEGASISVRFPNGAEHHGIKPKDYTKSGTVMSVDDRAKRMAYVLCEYLYEYMKSRGHVIGDIIAQFDTDGDGFISQDELCQAMAVITDGTANQAHVKQAVTAIDEDGDNRISTHELERALHDAHSESAPYSFTQARTER